MEQNNKPGLNLALRVVAFAGSTLIGLLVFYASMSLLSAVLSLFETRDSVIPLIIELLVLVVLIFFMVKINSREKAHRKNLAEEFSRANLQKFIAVEILTGIVAGLLVVVIVLIINF